MNTAIAQVPTDLPAVESFIDDETAMVLGEDLRITFSLMRNPTGAPMGDMFMGISARWREGDVFADYTPSSETAGSYYKPGEIRVDDSGLLTAMRRQQAAPGVDIRHGAMVQLPHDHVGPVRAALAAIESRATRQGSLATTITQAEYVETGRGGHVVFRIYPPGVSAATALSDVDPKAKEQSIEAETADGLVVAERFFLRYDERV